MAKYVAKKRSRTTIAKSVGPRAAFLADRASESTARRLVSAYSSGAKKAITSIAASYAKKLGKRTAHYGISKVKGIGAKLGKYASSAYNNARGRF